MAAEASSTTHAIEYAEVDAVEHITKLILGYERLVRLLSGPSSLRRLMLACPHRKWGTHNSHPLVNVTRSARSIEHLGNIWQRGIVPKIVLSIPMSVDREQGQH